MAAQDIHGGDQGTPPQPQENGGENASPLAAPEFNLPQDITLLSQMRDQLEDYLAAIERNTDSINSWLMQNQDDIILVHHQLARAITHAENRDAAKAMAILESNRDSGISGFILSLQDFEDIALKNFSADSSFNDYIRAFPKGLPPAVIEELPEVVMPDSTLEASANIAIAMNAQENKAAEPVPEKKSKGFWGSVTGIFKSAATKEAEEKAILEEQRKKEAAETRRRWYALKNELVSLQSDRHYYVDSLMDWVGEALAPEDAQKPLSAVMDEYQNPQYVIDRAREDYNETLNVKSALLRDKALEYSAAAALLDNKDTAGFIALLPQLFNKNDNAKSEQYRRLMLRDLAGYGISFAELSLNYIEDRKEQYDMLEAVLKYEPGLLLKDRKTKKEIFNRILDEVLDEKDPLNFFALSTVLDKLGGTQEERAEIVGLDTENSAFRRITQRFGNDHASLDRGLTRLLRGFSPFDNASAGNLVASLKEAVDNKNAKALDDILDAVKKNSAGRRFMALWELCGLGSVLEAVTAASDDPARLSQSISRAIDAGILDEVRVNAGAAFETPSAAIRFMGEKVMTNIDSFDVNAARKMIAFAFANGGLDELRLALTQKDGWLAAVAASPKIADEKRIEWIAALLEPFESDIVKANTLIRAADNAPEAAGKMLRAIEANFIGRSIQLTPEKLVTNIENIANIWYARETKSLRFTTNGAEYILLNDVSPRMAVEIYDLFSRRSTFMHEHGGLLRPENIDRIATENNVTSLIWGRVDTKSHLSPDQIDKVHTRQDFLHVESGSGRHSFNLDSVALLQKKGEDKWLLIDKYGYSWTFAGNITIPLDNEIIFPLNDSDWFNPSCAGLISADPAAGLLKFHIQSPQFQRLAGRDDLFYPVPAAPDKIETLLEALDRNPAMAAPDKQALGNLYFNFGQLGYLYRADQKNSHGFECLTHSTILREKGYIPVTLESSAEKIQAGLEKNPNLIALKGLFLHKDRIDNVYYNSDNNEIALVIGKMSLKVTLSPAEAADIIEKLAKNPAFRTIAWADDQKPMDMVKMKNTTLIYYNESDRKPEAVCGEGHFSLALDRSQMQVLFKQLQEENLVKRGPAWTRNLAGVLGGLRWITVPSPAPLTAKDPAYLLRHLIIGADPASDQQKNPAAQADFSIAAAKNLYQENAMQMFDYPKKTPVPPASRVTSPSLAPRKRGGMKGIR